VRRALTLGRNALGVGLIVAGVVAGLVIDAIKRNGEIKK